MNLSRLKRGPGRCAKKMIGLFGSLFLMAFLFVPCTTTTSSYRTDPYSKMVIRTTHPRNSYIFFPQYLSMRAHPQEGRALRVRSFQWSAFMGIILFLGLFDYALFCRLLGRARRPPSPGDVSSPDEAGSGGFSSSLSLFR